MQKSPALAHVLALGTIAVWAMTFISSKILLETQTPLEIVLFRFLLAVILLTLLRPHAFRHGRGWREELLFAGAGATGVTIYFLLENTALLYTYASNASVIICTVPFFSGLAARFFLGDRPSGGFFLGFIIAITGIAVISFNGATTLGLNPVGDLMALGATMTWAIYSILTRTIFSRGYPMLETTRRILCWGVFTVLLCLPFQSRIPVLPDFSSPVVLGNLLFLGLIASGVCYNTWNYALHVIGVVRTTVYMYLTPAITVAGAALFLDEKITLPALAGMALTVTGLVISERRKQTKKMPD